MFTGEFWEVFQNTSFIEHLWETAYFMYKLKNFIQVYEKNSFTHPPFMYFAFIFSEPITNDFFRRGFESVRAQILSDISEK